MIFRGQLQRIHDYMFHIIVAIVIFILGFVIAYSYLPKPQFDGSIFDEQQKAFRLCVHNDDLFLSAKTFEKKYRKLSLKEISTQYKILKGKIPTDCGAFHVESSYEQLEKMALSVLAEAQKFYKSNDVKVVNAVYTSASKYNALLDRSQPYLFFISDNKQDRIIAIKVSPTKNDLLIEPLWGYEKSENLAYTQGEVQKLLLVYNEIKN